MSILLEDFMGGRDRNKHWGGRSSSGSPAMTLGDAIPKRIKDRLSPNSQAALAAPATPKRDQSQETRALTVLSSGDPRMLAAHLLGGDITVGEIPVHLHQAVLACVREHHKAVSARNDETIRAQRAALEAANKSARDRDESRVQVEDDVGRQRRTAQEIGRQAGELHTELERSRATIADLKEALRMAKTRNEELVGEVEELQTAQLGLTEGAIFRVFQELVAIQVPLWLGEREGLFRKAEFLCRELEELRGQANDLLVDVRADIEDAEEAKVDRTFAADASGWTLYLEKVGHMRTSLSMHRELVSKVQHLSTSRHECMEAYEQLDKKGKELKFTILSIVHTFSLIGVDVWDRVNVERDLLNQLEPPTRVVVLMMSAIPTEELSEDWQGRVDVLLSHILTPKQVRRKKPETPAAQVHFFPGRIFMVEPDREVERLVGILLHEVQLAKVTIPLFPDEIAQLLLRAGLTNKARDMMTQEVIKACKVLSARGMVRRCPRTMEGMNISTTAYMAREVFCEQYARVELAQVESGHGELLREKLKRVIPRTES